jgi:energy-coupling factor transport system permease protein
MRDTKTAARTLDVRTLLIIVICLSSVSVIRQIVAIQIAVTIITLTLLSLRANNPEMLLVLVRRLKRIWIAVFAVVFFQLVFRREGDVIFSFYLLSITDSGLAYAVIVGLRLINIVLIAGLLFDISSSEYLLAFKSWRFPYEISFIITTVIRFIPDFYSLFTTYGEALHTRGIRLAKLKLVNKMKAAVSLLTAALIQSLNDVSHRAIALDLKGFRRYPTRTYLHDVKLRPRDIVVQSFSVIVAVLAIIII